MKYQKQKFKVGDEVIVCQDLITTIDSIDIDEDFGHHVYWFRDKDGKKWWESEVALELLSNCRIKKNDTQNSI